jgi:hypothetical protein
MAHESRAFLQDEADNRPSRITTAKCHHEDAETTMCTRAAWSLAVMSTFRRSVQDLNITVPGPISNISRPCRVSS